MATSAREAKEKVYTLAKEALPDMQVTFGGVKNPQKSWCMVGQVRYITSDWAAIGARHRKETYEVSIVINCVGSGFDAATVENKVLAAADALESAFRADPTLGGFVAQGCALIPKRFSSQPTNDGFEGQWDGVVRFTDVRI